MPLASEERGRILRSLLTVGPAKAIGYLPRNTISALLGMSEDTLIADANSRGLAAVSLGPAVCCIKSGALYIYDRGALGKLLSASAHTLTACDMATEPDEFVLQVAAIWFDRSHAVYPIIAMAFGDTV